MLIKGGADVNKLDVIFEITNDFYTENDMKYKILKILFTKNIKISSSAISNSIKKCNLEIVKLLYENIQIQVKIEDKKFVMESLFVMACNYNKLDMVEFFIKNGADVNCNAFHLERMPLYVTDSFEIIKLLIENGANLNNHLSKYVLFKHCEKGNYEIVKLLIESGMEIERDDEKSPLYLSTLLRNCGWGSKRDGSNTIQNKIKITKLLIENGDDVNFQSKTRKIGYTPLLNAIYSKNKEIVKILIDAGVNINICTEAHFRDDDDDDYDYSPLMMAVDVCKENDIVRLLIQAGANTHFNRDNLEKCQSIHLTFIDNYKKDAMCCLINIGNNNKSFELPIELYKIIYSYI